MKTSHWILIGIVVVIGVLIWVMDKQYGISWLHPKTEPKEITLN